MNENIIIDKNSQTNIIELNQIDTISHPYMEAILVGDKRFYRCIRCDYNSEYKVAILRHLEKKKGCNEKNQFQCKVCGKNYKQRDQLEAHQSKKNACGILEKVVEEQDVIKHLENTPKPVSLDKIDTLEKLLQTRNEEIDLLKKKCDNLDEELKYWKDNTVSEMKKLYKKQMVLYMKHKDYEYETFIYALTKWNDGTSKITDLTYFMDRMSITRIKEFFSLVNKYNKSLLPMIKKYIDSIQSRQVKKIYDKDAVIYEVELKKNLKLI